MYSNFTQYYTSYGVSLRTFYNKLWPISEHKKCSMIITITFLCVSPTSTSTSVFSNILQYKIHFILMFLHSFWSLIGTTIDVRVQEFVQLRLWSLTDETEDFKLWTCIYTCSTFSGQCGFLSHILGWQFGIFYSVTYESQAYIFIWNWNQTLKVHFFQLLVLLQVRFKFNKKGGIHELYIIYP